MVDLLLKHHSKGDHQTKTGCTPLMEATRFVYVFYFILSILFRCRRNWHAMIRKFGIKYSFFQLTFELVHCVRLLRRIHPNLGCAVVPRADLKQVSSSFVCVPTVPS